MTRLKARMIAGGFAILMVAILVNLLLLQPDDPTRQARRLVNANEAETASLHESDRSGAGGLSLAERYARRSGTLSRDDLSIGGPATGADANGWSDTDEEAAMRATDPDGLDDDPIDDYLPTQKLVRAMQAELTRRGYTPGPIDGIPGVITHASIMAYEFDNRLPLTGQPSADLLRHMLMDAGTARRHRRTNKGVSRATAARITRGVQKTLADLGYAPGPAHGRLGEQLRAAIREFEGDRKLVATGRVSGRLIRALNKATGVSFARAMR